MKRLPIMPFCAVLVLMLVTGGFLLYLQQFQQFTPPGVRLASKPMLDEDGNVVGNQMIDLPESVLDFKSESQPVSKVVLGWLPKDTTYGQRTYKAKDGFMVGINAVLMGTDRTSIHDPKYCLTGQGWKIEKTEQISIPISKPHAYALPAMKLTLSGQSRTPEGASRKVSGVYIYWFVAENRITADHGERMLHMAWELIRTGGLVRAGKLQRWAYITAFSMCIPGQEESTTHRMHQMLAAAVPEFQVAAGPQSKSVAFSSQLMQSIPMIPLAKVGIPTDAPAPVTRRSSNHGVNSRS